MRKRVSKVLKCGTTLTIYPLSDDMVCVTIDGKGERLPTFRASIREDGTIAEFMVATKVIPQVLKLAARFAPKPKVKKVK